LGIRKKNGKKIKDKPCIELRPIENIRIDAGADWIDPINSSPYLCDIIPMYVCKVKRMMKNKHPKTGEPPWKTYKDKDFEKAKPTRSIRCASSTWEAEDSHVQDRDQHQSL
jgi:hypothetical protein